MVSAPVHSAFPQMQGAALLGADPSVFVQAGAVRVHMHVREPVPQDVVEEVFVLKNRPLWSLKHPRGSPDHDPTTAVVSPQPTALAASSHSASLPTHPPPLLSVHRPDVRASNTLSGVAVGRNAAAHMASAVAMGCICWRERRIGTKTTAIFNKRSRSRDTFQIQSKVKPTDFYSSLTYFIFKSN